MQVFEGLVKQATGNGPERWVPTCWPASGLSDPPHMHVGQCIAIVFDDQAHTRH